MKDQYFGDINDYRKYGLLRCILEASELRLFVAWLLTPDDGSAHGNSRSYLDNPDQWARHDPPLFWNLKEMLANHSYGQVGLIENTDILPNAQYFSEIVPDSANERDSWFSSLVRCARESNIVFLDPDNGLEVDSRPYGSKDSSKYLLWHEVSSLWSSDKSLLIYQHFIRENRLEFTERLLKALGSVASGAIIEAFSTPKMVFLMALQPEHHHFHKAIVSAVQEKWEGQINHGALTLA